MSTFISLLRAINLAGHKVISMDALRDLYAGLGLSHLRTYIQSGNVVFESPWDDLSELTHKIEAHIEGAFGFHVEVFIRRPPDFLHILSNNPFLNDRQADPGRLYVTFLYHIPSEEARSKLAYPTETTDEYALGVQEVYLHLPNGYAHTKLSNSFFEKKLSTFTTTRNWNTVKALYEMATTA